MQNAIRAHTLNEVIQASTKALKTKKIINNHFHSAILNLAQQIDLLEEA